MMINKKIVTPSSQVDSTLPRYIVEQYERFVEFMTFAAESEERLGFSTDLIQRLHIYRNFDTYAKPIVEHTFLVQKIDERTESNPEIQSPNFETQELEFVDTGRTSVERNQTKQLIVDFIEGELVLESGDGFPEENGLLLIDDEIILYRKREGNICRNLTRGASATTALGNYLNPSVFRTSVPAKHFKGAKVVNLSSLFLAAILDVIHKTYVPSIDSKNVNKLIDRAAVLKNIKHFFQSKGTKLGIKALFKIVFAENDVEVFYPGDRMIIPSKSTWAESKLVRVEPVPWVLTDTQFPFVEPDKLIGKTLELKSYNSNNIYGTIIVDYCSKYSFEDEIHYEIFVEKDNVVGDNVANPKTSLTRDLHMYGTSDDGVDVYTITVESTLGFPESGYLIIGKEAIKYGSKSFNQFFNCERGKIGVDSAYLRGTDVYGPYYYEGFVDIDGITHCSRSFPLGLVEDVRIDNPGVLHELTDEVFVNGPGRVDHREPILASIDENYDDQLVSITDRLEPIEYFGNYTAGPNGIFFDDKHVFVAASTLPYSVVGPFCSRQEDILGDENWNDFQKDSEGQLLLVDNKNTGKAVGPLLKASDHLHVIPRRSEIKSNSKYNQQIRAKGTDAIGMFIDGVPAYSNVSPEREYQGKIAHYDIINPGIDYMTPTLLLDEKEVDEEILLDDRGAIQRITVLSSDDNYKTSVDARITSGEGAAVAFKFDNFGRVKEVELLSGGQYYKDVPSLSVEDASGRGKGAVLACSAENGEIVSVSIVQEGIDYNPDTTTGVFTPVGHSGEVFANIQAYQYDRHFEIINTPIWNYDIGKGFVFENKEGERTNYAYIVRPDWLSNRAKDTLDKHSPIMGWAFDGNPIYGPIGYANKKDDSDGLVHYRSSYVLLPDRSEIYPFGHDVPELGTLPPSETSHPMGTFVEDYEYNPDQALDKLREKIIIDTETPERLIADVGDNVARWLLYGKLPDKIDGQYPGLLDEYNSVVCNTPEYPKELYPDGVRCYFLTVDYDLEPEYPYIIGPTFFNRPISQHLHLIDEDRPEPIDTEARDPMSSYDETMLTFDYDRVHRYRNRYLSPTNDEVEVEITDTLDGGIAQIVVEDGLPVTQKVGDIVLYNSGDTGGGGAEGRISFIEGVPVEDGRGSDIKTVLLSHIQIINVNACMFLDPQGDRILEDRSHVFERGSIIQTSSGAKAVVFGYDTETTDLTVKTFTKNLIQYGELFRDNRHQLIKIPRMEEIGYTSLEQLILTTESNVRIQNEEELNAIQALGQHREMLTQEPPPVAAERTTFYSVVEPDTELEDLTAGDLWFSIQTGRLYIFYVDQDDTKQWVVVQPTGTIPMEGALNQSIGYREPSEQTPILAHAPNVVTICNQAPDERQNGTPHEYGDFWFSPWTNTMYMFYNMEWVPTTPNGITPLAQSPLSIPNWPTPERIHPWQHTYETSLYVIVKLTQPRFMDDGSPLKLGVLWFSPVTGKLYIRNRGKYGEYWQMTNPLGMMPNEYALDTSGEDGGTIVPPPLRPGPELPPGHPDGSGGDLAHLAGINYLWFEQLKYFRPEDDIQFYNGAPGTSANELAQIVSIAEGGAPAAAVVRRGDPMIEQLLDRTPTYNRTRWLFTIRTKIPHQLRIGDMVFIENSEEELINGLHEVIDSGFVEPAEGYGRVENGEIVEVVITNPGAYYREDFFISFYSGGGVGGYARVNVDPLAQGGSIRNVEVLWGGLHYERDAKIIWPEVMDAHEFAIFTPSKVEQASDFDYSTDSPYPQNKAKYIEVTSKGIGYERMPPIEGIYKKEIDRAEVEFEMRGTKIHKVHVTNPGTRYDNPRPVLVDLTGNGSGAVLDAFSEDGAIKEVVVYEGGSGYIEPQITFVEDKGKYISTTLDIGRLKAFDVVKPGRQILPDYTLSPELMITTRVVLSGVVGEIKPTMKAFQGTPDVKLCEGSVVDYDDKTQIVTLEMVDGKIRNGEKLNFYYSEYVLTTEQGAGAETQLTEVTFAIDKDDIVAEGIVICNGQADTDCVIDGISSPRGDFIDDTSKVSTRYAVTQDSYYYQWFSYVISSPIQKSKYESMVQTTIHPAGFIMFADLTISEFCNSDYQIEEIIIT